MEVLTYTKSGAKAAASAKLDASIFDNVPSSHDLLKLAYSCYLANGRINLATTKNRGDVSGGGKKPWRQKGTGRARVGSSRVPHWRGGGVAFGPTGQENYRVTIPVKAKRQAVRQALSLAAAANNVKVIDTFEPTNNKVSAAVKLLNKLEAEGRVLIVLEKMNDEISRSIRNLQNVELAIANHLNVFHILNADTIIFEKKSLDILEEWLSVQPKAQGAKS